MVGTFDRLTTRIVKIAQNLGIDPDIELNEEKETIIVLFGNDEEMSCYEFIKTVRDQLSMSIGVEGDYQERFNIAIEKDLVSSAGCWDVEVKFSDKWSLTESITA